MHRDRLDPVLAAAALCWTGTTSYLLLAARPGPPLFPHSDLVGHFGVTALLTALVYLLFHPVGGEMGGARRLVLVAVGLGLLVVLGLEALQLIRPTRSAEMADVAADVAGAAAGAGATARLAARWTVLLLRSVAAGLAFVLTALVAGLALFG